MPDPHDDKQRDDPKADSPYKSPRADSERGPNTFSLAMLLFAVTVLSVAFALMARFVGLGFAVLVIAVQLIIRIVIHRRTGWLAGLKINAMSGLLMMGVAVLAVVCCIITFTTTCFATGLEMVNLGGRWADDFFWIACTVGVVAALQTGELIMALLLRSNRN